jgi:hypothetical protein
LKNGVPSQELRWSSYAGTEMVLPAVILLAMKKAMNFVMKGKCIDVDSASHILVSRV